MRTLYDNIKLNPKVVRLHIVNEMDLEQHRRVRTFEIHAASLSEAFKRMDSKGWGKFYRHPRRSLYIRRSHCGRYQQTVRQFELKEKTNE